MRVAYAEWSTCKQKSFERDRSRFRLGVYDSLA